LHHRTTVIFEVPCSPFATDTPDPDFVLELSTALSSSTLERIQEDIGIKGEKLEAAVSTVQGG